MTREEILNLTENDFQQRKGKYPKSNIPDDIIVRERDNNFVITASFKNTTESNAKYWLNNYVKKFDLNIVDESKAWQDGDYQDDWVIASITVSI